jgi:threonine synthase
MARLLAHYRQGTDTPLTVLTATSGDTGGAVAHAFLGLPGVRVVVLFPDGKVSPRQERQFSTLGENVTAVAVQGDFDDCQRLAKEAFQQHARLGGEDLTSANSINIGRFLPQTTYFFEAWARLQAGRKNRTDILFSVPSGNFGNLAAGLLAKAMGMTGASFLAATNLNDGVPEYLRTGRFTPRPSTRTLSTAMDVGDPSNLDRILHLYEGSLDALRKDLVGRRVTDTETDACIRRVHRETGYILDPHSAVGFSALEKELEARTDATGVLLATAHPAKFAEVVEPAIGQPLPIPPELAARLNAPRKVVPIEPRLDALKALL